MHGVGVRGIVSAVPDHEQRNDAFPHQSERERSQFIQTTGISKRYIVANGQTVSDLFVPAADHLLDGLGWDRDSIDVLIVVTQTPEHPIPGPSSAIQQRLGLPTSVLAMDVNMGCSGYVYGLFTASSMLGNGLRRALLLVGDTSSTCIHPQDKTTAPLFSDAVSATALEHDADAPDMTFSMGTDGTGRRAIHIPAGGSAWPVNTDALAATETNGVIRRPVDMSLDGMAVFTFALQRVPADVRDLLAFTGLSIEDIDMAVFHQANKLINDRIRNKLNIPDGRVATSIEALGNTSSASIPVTINHALHDRLDGPATLLLSGFGVGLSWASAIVRFENVYCPPVHFQP